MDYYNLSFRKHWKQLTLCLLVYIVAAFGSIEGDAALQQPIVTVSVEGIVARWALYYLYAMVVRLLGMIPFCALALAAEYIGFTYAMPTIMTLYQAGAIWALAIILMVRFLFLLIPCWYAVVISWQQTKLLIHYRDVRYLRWDLPTQRYTLAWLVASFVVTLVELGVAVAL